MNRTRDYYRHHRARAINRKRAKIRSFGFDWYDSDGKYSKGKIHCSCWMCATKSKKDGRPVSELRHLKNIDYNEVIEE